MRDTAKLLAVGGVALVLVSRVAPPTPLALAATGLAMALIVLVRRQRRLALTPL